MNRLEKKRFVDNMIKNGFSYRVIGEKMNLTYERIRQIYHEPIDRMLTSEINKEKRKIFWGGKEYSGRERTRYLVRVRDSFTCQDCNLQRTPAQAKKLEKKMFDIHHLNGLCGKKSRAYDKVSDMAGLITLCHKCHFNRPEHTSKKRRIRL